MTMGNRVHFDITGFVIKQNYCIWTLANPRVYTVAANSLTVIGVHYRYMAQNCLVPQIQQFNLQNMWSQQDGAICHTVRETMNLLRTIWPPRLPDLT